MPVEALNPAGIARDQRDAEGAAFTHAIGLVGSRSALLLMHEAFYGTTRFDDFVRRAGVSVSVTARWLKNLVAAGLLERRPYQEPGERTRYSYHLTETGAGFFPVLAALTQWGDLLRGPGPASISHQGCGSPVRAELRCRAGHLVTVPDIGLVPANAAGDPASVRGKRPRP